MSAFIFSSLQRGKLEDKTADPATNVQLNPKNCNSKIASPDGQSGVLPIAERCLIEDVPHLCFYATENLIPVLSNAQVQDLPVQFHTFLQQSLQKKMSELSSQSNYYVLARRTVESILSQSVAGPAILLRNNSFLTGGRNPFQNLLVLENGETASKKHEML